MSLLGWVGTEMNKFEHVSSDHYQMSLAGVGGYISSDDHQMSLAEVVCPGGGGQGS